jgi:hypothetical protein
MDVLIIGVAASGMAASAFLASRWYKRRLETYAMQLTARECLAMLRGGKEQTHSDLADIYSRHGFDMAWKTRPLSDREAHEVVRLVERMIHEEGQSEDQSLEVLLSDLKRSLSWRSPTHFYQPIPQALMFFCMLRLFAVIGGARSSSWEKFGLVAALFVLALVYAYVAFMYWGAKRSQLSR